MANEFKELEKMFEHGLECGHREMAMWLTGYLEGSRKASVPDNEVVDEILKMLKLIESHEAKSINEAADLRLKENWK